MVDRVLLITIVVAVAVGLCSMLIGQLVAAYDWLRARLFGLNDAAEPELARSIETPHLNDVEPDERAFANAFELVLNDEEVAAVARMIKHNRDAAKPSKSSTIQAGFGVSRGGSPTYQRASAIYDALFGAPEPAVLTPIAERPTRAKFARQ